MLPHLAFLLLGLTSALAQGTGPDLDPALVDSIFGKVPGKESTTQPGAPLFMGSDGFGSNNQGNCICVPYHNCDSNNVIILDGQNDGFGVIDIRFGQNAKCKHYLDLCCTYPLGYDGPGIITSSTPDPGSVIDPVVPIDPPVSQVIPTSRPPTLPPTPPPTPPPTLPPTEIVRCGQRNAHGVGFSIKGNSDREAEYGEFPWMVEILRRNWIAGGKEPLAVCGGSLIHPQVVLTGAHCIENNKGISLDATDIKIRAGEWDTQTDKERYPYQERNVETIIKHKDFHNQVLFNDIALLVLESPVVYAANVKPVCLPTQGQKFDQKECYASGWGKTEFAKESSPAVILKKIDLPIVPFDVCQNQFKKTRLGKDFTLHRSFLCAGGIAGKDACTGDGGGPLVCPGKQNPERYVQAGIVAWGVGCGGDMIPGAYANVALFRDWIDEQMQYLRFDTSSYTV